MTVTSKLKRLSPEQFELVVAAVLEAEGLGRPTILGGPGQPDRGVDLRLATGNGELWVIQVSSSVVGGLQTRISDLKRGQQVLGASRAILATASEFTSATRHTYEAKFGVIVWDGTYIQDLLAKHPGIEKRVDQLINVDHALHEFARTAHVQFQEGAALVEKLQSVERGKTAWKQYEDVCVEILTYLFVPPLRQPIVQSRTQDGLDRRDAIFPIGAGGEFWDAVRFQHNSRMIVVEFKNHSDPIGQREVECLQQYLLPSARRSFGILCSRTDPSASAYLARRRAWMIAENMILFVSDGQMVDMIQRKENGQEPARILDDQLDEFFIELAP